MIITVKNEAPWQILSNAMTISPSSTGYDLQVSANGKDYSTLFSVGAGITRQVTNLSSGSYFRMLGNIGEVVVNWVRDCSGGGGTGGNAGELEPVTDFPVDAPAGTVVALSSGGTVGVYQYDGMDWAPIGGGDMSNYYTKAETDAAITSATQDFATQADITAATSPIQSQVDDIERVTATALTELHDAILEISGSTGGSNYIIPAITSQTEYDAISGDVKTGDLIQVWDVDINDDGEGEYGLFQAYVDQGSISWNRKDNGDSLLWSNRDYPWMTDNDVSPVDLGAGGFLISKDIAADDGSFNGIGFDGDGKPVITHIVPQYDEQTGEVTGMTRDDRDILGELDTLDQVVSAALVDLNEKKVESEDIKHIVKLTQAEYDQLATKDPETFYIIITNNN